MGCLLVVWCNLLFHTYCSLDLVSIQQSLLVNKKAVQLVEPSFDKLIITEPFITEAKRKLVATYILQAIVNKQAAFKLGNLVEVRIVIKVAST